MLLDSGCCWNEDNGDRFEKSFKSISDANCGDTERVLLSFSAPSVHEQTNLNYLYSRATHT